MGLFHALEQPFVKLPVAVHFPLEDIVLNAPGSDLVHFSLLILDRLGEVLFLGRGGAILVDDVVHHSFFLLVEFRLQRVDLLLHLLGLRVIGLHPGRDLRVLPFRVRQPNLQILHQPVRKHAGQVLDLARLDQAVEGLLLETLRLGLGVRFEKLLQAGGRHVLLFGDVDDGVRLGVSLQLVFGLFEFRFNLRVLSLEPLRSLFSRIPLDLEILLDVVIRQFVGSQSRYSPTV